MTRENRSIKTIPQTVSYTFTDISLLTKQHFTQVGWALSVPSKYQLQTSDYGDVYVDTASPNIGFIININGAQASDNIIGLNPIVSAGEQTISATVSVTAVQLRLASITPDKWIAPSFEFDLIPVAGDNQLSSASLNIAGLLSILGTSYKKSHISTENLTNWYTNTAYVSYCFTPGSFTPDKVYTGSKPLDKVVNLPPQTANQFDEQGNSLVSATFTLDVENCGALNDDKDTLWINDVKEVYVTFADVNNNNNSSDILTNTGTAKGVGFRIYPEGSPQSVHYTPTGTLIYGFPGGSHPMKSNGQATQMEYVLGAEETRKGNWNLQPFTMRPGSASKTFRVFYAKDPSQGATVTPGTVIGKATFTFSYQ
nr:fimbrial protein [Pelistega europaea]